MRSLAICILALFALAPASAATFTVTNTNDSGAGSLWQAIDDANSAPTDDTIEILVTGTVTLTAGQQVVYEVSIGGSLK